MDSHHRDTQKNRNSNISAHMTKPNRRWTLLYVGNKGRVLTLKRFKSFVLLTILLFAVSISISVFLFMRSQNIGKEKKELQISLQSLQKQVKGFRHEKEIMMARLVLAESRVGKSASGQERNDLQTNNKKSSAGDLQKTGSPATAPSNTIASTQTGPDSQSQTQRAQLKPDLEKPTSAIPQEIKGSNLSVAIEEFNASNQADNAIVQFRFKIKNTSPDSQKVSGHAIVVLKGDSIGEQKWVSIPVVSLVSGKPTGRKKGYAFSISYFRNMRFKTDTPATAQVYNQASVYIFSKTGELLLEQDFPVGLSPSRSSGSPLPSNSKDAVPDASSDDSR